MDKNRIISKWDEAADDWIKILDKNIWRRHLLLPLIIDLLGEVRGTRIIDIGCGEGEFARILSAKGADVLGIDGSQRLISVAIERSRANEGDLRFCVCNASRLESINDGTYDTAISMMCIMAIVEFDEAIKEMARVLKPNGRAVVTTLHPCFTGPHAGMTINGNTNQHTNDHYFKEEWFEEGLSNALQKSLPFHHRTLENLIMPFLDSGFTLKKLIEPNPSDALIEEFSGMAPLRRIPQFIALDFKRNG